MSKSKSPEDISDILGECENVLRDIMSCSDDLSEEVAQEALVSLEELHEELKTIKNHVQCEDNEDHTHHTHHAHHTHHGHHAHYKDFSNTIVECENLIRDIMSSSNDLTEKEVKEAMPLLEDLYQDLKTVVDNHLQCEDNEDLAHHEDYEACSKISAREVELNRVLEMMMLQAHVSQHWMQSLNVS